MIPRIQPRSKNLNGSSKAVVRNQCQRHQIRVSNKGQSFRLDRGNRKINVGNIACLSEVF